MLVVAVTKSTIRLIYSFCQVQVAQLTSKEAIILVKYSHFSDFFHSDSLEELPK